MILDQYGKPVQRASIAPSEAVLSALNTSALKAMRESLDFMDSIRSRVVDHRGEPVWSTLPKIGSTIQVRKPYRFAQ